MHYADLLLSLSPYKNKSVMDLGGSYINMYWDNCLKGAAIIKRRKSAFKFRIS